MALHTVVFNYLIIAPHVLLAAILVLLIRRRLVREFPAFFLYVVSELLQFLVLFTLLRLPSVSGPTYAIGYSVGLAVSTALRFAVLYEIISHILRNHVSSANTWKSILHWTAAGLLLTGALLAAYAGGNDFYPLLFVVNVLDRAASILQCGLLITLLAFAAYIRLPWRSNTFGIALGLGILASVELANAAIRTYVGFAYSTYLDYLTMATYHACVLIWIYYLWVPERVPVQTQKLPEQDLEAWNRELQRLIQQ
jgi:hypothetical protein